jgi:alpha-glucosidase
MQKIFLKFSLVLILVCLGANSINAQSATVKSPDGKIDVKLTLASGQLTYTVAHQNEIVLKPSKLGLIREDADLSKDLVLLSSSPVQKVADQYQMIYGKKKNINYQANKKVFHFRNNKNDLLDVVFQVSNDGVAFRYFFPGKSSGVKKIMQELSSFHFDTADRAWLQPMQVSKSGWEQTNPAYEEHYKQNIPVVTGSPTTAGWVYPALFCHNSTWLLITEAYLDSNYCASRLQSATADGEYYIGFPDPREVIKDKNLLPRSALPFFSPWRIITIGSLKTIAESTLGTDLAKPAIKMNTAFIKPGKSSWSWIMSKDDFIVFDEQKRYIDFAADMHWQYCLVDAAWDKKIGYEKIKELADYAATKNVGLLLWYNSAGDWNTVKYTPKDLMLTHESRMKEFSRLKSMGIKGVKIDFFGGDGQSVIKYYHEILKDAADYQLMVNFHGATLPRGWARTYPNLVTTEAVRGFEMITFGQGDADAEANHCAVLPFTRNAFDPMDFTPMNLYTIPTQSKRKTTSSFELALSVIFLSGIQHYAESPDGMGHLPEYVKQFLRELPDSWDDLKFIDGFPGKFVVLGRRLGNKWYIAGINSDGTSGKTFDLDLSGFNKSKGHFITDGTENASFVEEHWSLQASKKKKISVKSNGGFVLVLE